MVVVDAVDLAQLEVDRVVGVAVPVAGDVSLVVGREHTIAGYHRGTPPLMSRASCFTTVVAMPDASRPRLAGGRRGGRAAETGAGGAKGAGCSSRTRWRAWPLRCRCERGSAPFPPPAAP